MFLYKRRSSSQEIQVNSETWETIGIDLLHRKYKFEFTPSEKQLLKNMLKQAPPPLHTRRKVIFKINIIKLLK